MERAALALSGALVALLASVPDAAAQSGKLEYAYVVLGGHGAIARTILSGTVECPTINLGGAAERMNVRAPADDAFPVLVCETLMPPGTTSATIDGGLLPLPPLRFATIATFGDTGCGSRPEEIPERATGITTIRRPANSKIATARRNGRSRG